MAQTAAPAKAVPVKAAPATAVPVKAAPAKAPAKAPPPQLPDRTYQVDWQAVDAIQHQGNTNLVPLKAHKAPPPNMPAAICATAHTIPDTPTPEDQTRIVVQDWNTLKTELNSFWPTFKDDFAYSKNALKRTISC